MFEHASNLNRRKRERHTVREGERERERPPNTRAISCYGLHRNQIQLLWIAIFINNLCYFISGMSHNVFSDLREGGGLMAGGWLNNENGLRGNEELRLSITTVVSLFSPLVRSGTTEMLLMWPLPGILNSSKKKGAMFPSNSNFLTHLFYIKMLFFIICY